jgi:pyruvate dehydrogenase E1 component
VIWGSDWDPLLAKDKDGILVKRMEETVDGQYQKYTVESGKYIRDNFFGSDPRLLEMVKNLSDEQLRKLRRGGHDMEKVYTAYKAAIENKGSPTVILAKTIKGYGLGEAGEGRNITHQQKKMNEEELREFRTRFGIPISDEDVSKAPFYKPPDDSPEMQYLQEHRRELGGYIPNRKVICKPVKVELEKLFEEFYKGSNGRNASTTMAYVRMLAKLLRDKEIGKLIVPIVPDEARTFGMEALFKQVGIYSHVGQLYDPVDSDTLLYYKEAKDGQILEEGITEAGSMSSFIAAGTAYATHGLNTIPFFIFYSMFGLQRIGDLVWAAGDMRCHGFLIGGTSGKTTLAGEGLQHQDGHSHLFAYAVPNLKAYDPAFAYEIAVIVQDGIKRMYEKQEDIFYYLTVTNEPYVQLPMPDGVKDKIIKGMYKLMSSENRNLKLHAQLFGSGAILNEVIKAKRILEERYEVSSDVWSITSYKELYTDGHEVERWNMLRPSEIPRVPYITQCIQDAPGVFVAVSDFTKALPDSISRWFPKTLVVLGADGFGRSDSRTSLRDFFEVDARFIAIATLSALAREKKIKIELVEQAIRDLEINPQKANPMIS